MRRNQERLRNVVIWTLGLPVLAFMAVCVVVMIVGLLRMWGAEPWKLLVASPIIAIFVWGAFEHYSDRG